MKKSFVTEPTSKMKLNIEMFMEISVSTCAIKHQYQKKADVLMFSKGTHAQSSTWLFL